MNQTPTHCCYCGAFDPQGESLVLLTVGVQEAFRHDRRTFVVSYCRSNQVCRQEAWRYVNAICDGEVEENLPLPPRGGSIPEN